MLPPPPPRKSDVVVPDGPSGKATRDAAVAPPVAGRRDFIGRYGSLAMVTPVAVHAMMSPNRAQAQVSSVSVADCVVQNGAIAVSDGNSCRITQSQVDTYGLSTFNISQGDTVSCKGGRVEISGGLEGQRLEMGGLIFRCK